MKRIRLLLQIILFSASSIFAGNQLIGKNVAVFYPPHYNPKPHQPSFALLQEPKAIGKISSEWKNTPSFYAKDGKSVAAIGFAKGTSLYGTGEVTGSLLRNGKTVKLWNTDNFKYMADGGKRLYQSHPWVLGVNADGTAFGVIADNTWKQQIDLSDSIRFISEGPAFRVIIIQRNSPQEVVKELASLIGKMQMPPLWALGYQQCRFSYVPDTRIKSIADTFRLKKLPCDVIWMDIDYMERFKIFTFDKTKIPDPKGVNDYLHAKGFHSVWMIDPGVKIEKDYPVYESGTAGNHWVQTADGKEFHGSVWPGPCVFPDYTRPETRSWWGGLYKDYMATGVDGVWNDMNEPSVFDGPDGTMPENNHHRGGGDLQADVHQRYHNVYGMLMVKASREGILAANPEKRPFILSRSGYLGSNRYAATWTGDNCSSEEHMQWSIPMTLNLGLSGQPFNGPDMGGFGLNATGELFGQWVAFGAFFPFVRGHATNDVNNKEPWAFGEEIENVSRTALNRRYQLLPYYYTLFHESSVNGLPVMRPLFFADAKDSTLRKEDQAFLVGDALLVIPRWAKNPALPQGIWRSFNLENNGAPTDKYQAELKLKGGSILPVGKVIQNTTEYSTDSLTLYVSLDAQGKAVGTLYEDAGDGFGYKKGEYLQTKFSAIQKGDNITLTLNSIEGKLKTKVRQIQLILISDTDTKTSKWIKSSEHQTLNVKL